MPKFENDYALGLKLHDSHNNEHINDLIKHSPVKMSDHEICKKYNQHADRSKGDETPGDTTLMTHDDALKHYANKGINSLISSRTKFSKQKASLGRKISNDETALDVNNIGKSLGAKKTFNDEKIQKSLLNERKQLKADKVNYSKISKISDSDLDVAQGIHNSPSKFISINADGNVHPATVKQLRQVVPNTQVIQEKIKNTHHYQDIINKDANQVKSADPMEVSKSARKMTTIINKLRFRYPHDKTIHDLGNEMVTNINDSVRGLYKNGIKGHIDKKDIPAIKNSYKKHGYSNMAKDLHNLGFDDEDINLVPEKNNPSQYRAIKSDDVKQLAYHVNKQLDKSISHDKQRLANFGQQRNQSQSVSKSRHVNQTSVTQSHQVQKSLFKTPSPTAIKKAKIQRAQGMQR